MIDKRIREAYREVDVPDLKEEILSAVTSAERKQERRRLRPAAAVLLSVVFLTMLMGAAAGGSLFLKDGSRYYFRGSDGAVVKPNGFHTEEAICAPLSEKALANIAPYVFAAGDPATLYETEERAEMEAFLEYPFRLPTAIDADFYRMWACGENGEAVSLYVQIPLTGAWEDGSMDVWLRGGPLNILTGSSPTMRDDTLADGTPVSIAVYKTNSGKNAAAAMYTDNGAVYHITLTGGSRNDLLTQMKAILDTVK